MTVVEMGPMANKRDTALVDQVGVITVERDHPDTLESVSGKSTDWRQKNSFLFVMLAVGDN